MLNIFTPHLSGSRLLKLAIGVQDVENDANVMTNHELPRLLEALTVLATGHIVPGQGPRIEQFGLDHKKFVKNLIKAKVRLSGHEGIELSKEQYSK